MNMSDNTIQNMDELTQRVTELEEELRKQVLISREASICVTKQVEINKQFVETIRNIAQQLATVESKVDRLWRATF